MITRRILIAGAGASVTFAAAPHARATSEASLRMTQARLSTVPQGAQAIIDDFTLPGGTASNGNSWRYIADGVMGGVSKGAMEAEKVAGRHAVRMTGQVSLDNNGGFIQLSLDLSHNGDDTDASKFTGIEIDTFGNGEEYNLHLRTPDLRRPWHSYRHSFVARPVWQTQQIPFSQFEAHQAPAPLNVAKLRRLGILAIGREFQADIAIGGLRFYA
ncbi:MAG: CIA30 family protein [Pseudomonadota bacterium]